MSPMDKRWVQEENRRRRKECGEEETRKGAERQGKGVTIGLLPSVPASRLASEECSLSAALALHLTYDVERQAGNQADNEWRYDFTLAPRFPCKQLMIPSLFLSNFINGL